MNLGHTIGDQIYGPLDREELSLVNYYRIGRDQGYSACYGEVENLSLSLMNAPSNYTVEQAAKATTIYYDACGQYTPSLGDFEPVLRTTSNSIIIVTLLAIVIIGGVLTRKLATKTSPN